MTKTHILVGATAFGLLVALSAMAEPPADAGSGKAKVACGQIVEDFAVSSKKSVGDTAGRVHADEARVRECLKANGTDVAESDGK
jgi:hypothetical protein